jgi:hypothetical protein
MEYEGLLSGPTASNAVLSPERGIFITKLSQPADGAVIALYCSRCAETVILHSEYALPPKDGDLWYFHEMCPNNRHFRMPLNYMTSHRSPGSLPDVNGIT